MAKVLKKEEPKKKAVIKKEINKEIKEIISSVENVDAVKKKPTHEFCKDCNHPSFHHYGGSSFWCNVTDCRCNEMK